MKRFINNKRGDGDVYQVTSKPLYYILVSITVAFLFIFFVSGGISLVDERTDVYPLLALDVYTSHLVNVCFAYVENKGETTEKRYQNVIDAKKLTIDTLEDCSTKGSYVTVTRLDDSRNFYELQHSKTTPEDTEIRYTLLRDGDTIYPATIEVRI